MRFALACAVALLLAPSFASSAETEPRDALAVSIYGGSDIGAIVSWTPAPKAIGYAVFRGATPQDAVLVAEVVGTLFHDAEPRDGESWYVVLSLHMRNALVEQLQDSSGYRGACVNRHGTAGVSITASHCLPADPL